MRICISTKGIGMMCKYLKPAKVVKDGVNTK